MDFDTNVDPTNFKSTAHNFLYVLIIGAMVDPHLTGILNIHKYNVSFHKRCCFVMTTLFHENTFLFILNSSFVASYSLLVSSHLKTSILLTLSTPERSLLRRLKSLASRLRFSCNSSSLKVYLTKAFGTWINV